MRGERERERERERESNWILRESETGTQIELVIGF